MLMRYEIDNHYQLICLLPVARCLLPVAFCLLPFAFCLSKTRGSKLTIYRFFCPGKDAAMVIIVSAAADPFCVIPMWNFDCVIEQRYIKTLQHFKACGVLVAVQGILINN